MVWSTILFVYSNKPIREQVMTKVETQQDRERPNSSYNSQG